MSYRIAGCKGEELTPDVPALQEQMDRLGDTALVGGERTDATDHLMAGIARLRSEVGDASSYLPAYDQRTYGEVITFLPTGFITSQTRTANRLPTTKAIKALREKLDETRASLAPRTRFAFKTLQKNPSAVSLSEAAEMAAREHRSPLAHDAASSESSWVNTPNYVQTPDGGSSPDPLRAPPPAAADQNSKDALEDGNKENASLDPRIAAIRRPTFSTSSTISITRQSNAHIILPSSASHASNHAPSPPSNAVLSTFPSCLPKMLLLSPA